MGFLRFCGPSVLLLAVLFCVGCLPARGSRPGQLRAGQALRYQLTLAPDLRTATVSLALPATARGRLLRLPRTSGWKARRWRIARVRCDGKRIFRDGDQGWPLPRSCRRATWRVRLARVEAGGYLAHSLLAARHPTRRWVFLPGAGYLLEVAGVRGRATLRLTLPPGVGAHHALDRLPDGRLLLPPAPASRLALIGVGSFEVRQVRVGTTRVRHLFAQPPPARFSGLLAVHKKALAYLVRVLGPPRGAGLDAYWFRLGPTSRMVSGYAGRRSVAISYVDKPRKAPHLVSALLPWLPVLLLLHEQVHQLGVAHPAWLSESLAQYYALKALGRSGAMRPADFAKALDRITRPWSRFALADGRIRMLTAYRRYLRSGSLRTYRVFYTNGARFWGVVDRAVVAKSGGRRSLDSIVRKVLKLRYDRQGRPPKAFHKLLLREGGAPARAAIARWVL